VRPGKLDVLTLVLGGLAAVGVAAQLIRSRISREKQGFPVEGPVSFWAKIIVAVVAIMALCWQLASYSGMPVILIILAVLILAYTFVLNRTVFGRHVYAIGRQPLLRCDEWRQDEARQLHDLRQHRHAGSTGRCGEHLTRGERCRFRRPEL